MLAMVFRIKIATAIKSSLTIGIGFVGIFMTFDYFIDFINPVVSSLVERTGLQFTVLDAGWPPLAEITWSFELAPLLLILFMVVNVVMLVLKLTKTVNIDIWNYWHIILAATMIYQVTESVFVTIGLSTLVFIMVLKLAEWTAPIVNKFSGMEGICIPHLAALVHYPYALLANKLIDKIPGLRDIDAKPEAIQKRFGILGEPMIMGLLMGIGLGIGGGYNFKQTSELAINFAAVIYILPKMAGILGGSLIPISEGMKIFISTKFPDMGETYIGLDVAVLFGIPSILVTSLLLIPVSLIASFILPGINFIPLGELANLVVPVAFICIATNGNVIRSFIIGIPMVITSLYAASKMAVFITEMAASNNYHLVGFNGVFTSFLDGGNYFRAWLVQLVSLNTIGLLFLPVVIIMLVFTWKETKNINSEENS
jgi:PTS system galactitol-specific IIC component